MIDSKLQDPFEIIIGTYEQYVLGYKVTNIVNEYKMEKSFATHSHVASVRSVSSSKYYTASAGADETICLYDMRYRRECGKLIHHNDTINCIAYTPENSHLFTCSKDGSIAAIHCGNWQIEKHWLKAHRGLAVNTLAIHPTGKLALSTGGDGALRTWNLIKGRQAYAINLIPKLKLDAKYVTIVKWSPDGERYLLGVNRKIHLYSVESAGIEKEIKLNSKVICAEFLKNNLIAIGLENGHIKFCDVEAQIETINKMAHNMRVKCIAHMNNLLVSASSSGEIKLWKYSKHSLHMLQSVNCGVRITCLSLAQICQNISENEVKSEEEEEVKEKNKIRVEQEVIVEYDDDDEIRNIGNPQTSKTKRKKKKAETEDAEMEDDNVPRSKKKASSDANVLHSKEKAKDLKEHKEEKTSKKRDRSSDIANEIAKCQKKKKMSEVNETDINKKRKKLEYASQAVLPTKKIKKFNKIEESSVSSKKYKITSTDLEDALSKRMKKTVNAEKAIPSRKKKRRITETD